MPLYGFLHGDCLGLVILVKSDDPVSSIAANLQQAAAPRVAPAARVDVWHRGRKIDPDVEIGASGIAPLDRVDVIPEDTW